MTKVFNHDDNIPDHENPNVKCTANRPSEEALMELTKLILEIY